jgi:tetratricopeptide (TPR) repeat protein
VNRRIEAVPLRDWTFSDHVIHGHALAFRPLDQEMRRDVQRCFEQALSMAPASIDAKIGTAGSLLINVQEGWTQSAMQDMTRAETLLVDVLGNQSDNAEGRTYLGMLRRLQGRLADARIELEIAVGLRPNNPFALGQLGITLAWLGQPAEAISLIERCLRLAPHDLITPLNLARLGLCKLLLGQIDEAVTCLRKGRAGNPRLYYIHMLLASALGLKGELAEAGAALRQAVEINSKVGSQSALTSMLTQTSPEYIDLYRTTVQAGLLLAGLAQVVPDFVVLPDA